MHPLTATQRRKTTAGLVVVILAALAVSVPRMAPASSAPSPTPAAGMYAYYYLWWDTAHWHTTLGSSYPYGQSPLPLPASLAPNGCNPTSLYPGNVETDVPSTLFTQDDPAQISYDVNSAIAAGLSGFAVDWKGTGTAGQSPSSDTENQRLDLLVRAVDIAQSEGHDFHLWLSYEASASLLSPSAISADLSYLSAQYGSDPAFDRSNGGKPTFVWVGSYKYPVATVAAISAQFRPQWYFVGGYQWNNWSAAVAPYFDADSPYWSSQDPWGNPQSFQQLAGLATTLHAEGKRYFAPLSPGFDDQLNGSSGCVPRNDGATLQALFAGNSAGAPDGWLLISWNEITEGTYVTPELQRYGGAYGGPNGYVRQLTGHVPHGVASSTACGAAVDQPSPGSFTMIAATASASGCAGYWMANAAGQVRAFGGAPTIGSLGFAPAAPIKSIVATPDGQGYWLLGSDGGVFALGDAGFFGSTGGLRLNAPVVGMAPTSDGRGYWLVAADGGVFSFGDATFAGSTGSLHLNAAVVGMAVDASTGGYWLVASDGGVFAFDSPFHGSMGAVHLNQPVVGVTADPAGRGYRMVASDGGIFSFGAPFYGSLGGLALSAAITSMSPSVDGDGYYLTGSDGSVYAFGDAPYLGRVTPG